MPVNYADRSPLRFGSGFLKTPSYAWNITSSYWFEEASEYAGVLSFTLVYSNGWDQHWGSRSL